MSTTYLAKHFHELHHGKNWTASSFKTHLADVDWKMANTEIHGLNSIATLIYHSGYYVEMQIRVLEGGPLVGNDKLSFEHAHITSEKEWQDLLATFWANADKMHELLLILDEELLDKPFVEEKYGNYHRNLQGMIEHSHYHLGQIVILKKIIGAQDGGS